LVSGSYYQKSSLVLPEGSSIPPRLIQTSAKSAELIKHASNAFLALKISFINAVANVCEQVGADVEQVTEGIGADRRIGKRFLQAGIGYGGSCFPKDVSAFQTVAAESGYEFRLLQEVSNINASQRKLFLRKVRNALWNLKGKTLGVLGLSFKDGTDDIRESPAIEIIQALLRDGCRIAAYDPAAMPRARGILSEPQVRFATDAYDVAHNSNALLILTDWREFTRLDLGRIRSALHYPLVIDGRNLFQPEEMAQAGLAYWSIGRPEVHLADTALTVQKEL